jgi:hypothetical protein
LLLKPCWFMFKIYLDSNCSIMCFLIYIFFITWPFPCHMSRWSLRFTHWVPALFFKEYLNRLPPWTTTTTTHGSNEITVLSRSFTLKILSVSFLQLVCNLSVIPRQVLSADTAHILSVWHRVLLMLSNIFICVMLTILANNLLDTSDCYHLTREKSQHVSWSMVYVTLS